jgi:hypothetical protein
MITPAPICRIRFGTRHRLLEAARPNRDSGVRSGARYSFSILAISPVSLVGRKCTRQRAVSLGISAAIHMNEFFQ